MLSGCCGSTCLCSPLMVPPFADNQRKEPREAFLVFIQARVLFVGHIYGKRVLGKRKQPRKEIGRGEKSEGEWARVDMHVCVCLLVSLWDYRLCVCACVCVSQRSYAQPGRRQGIPDLGYMNESTSDPEVTPSKMHQAPGQEQDADGLRGVNFRDATVRRLASSPSREHAVAPEDYQDVGCGPETSALPLPLSCEA